MPYKALVVEDDPQAVEMIEDALAALGHVHELACCLIEARRLLAAARYSYILAGIQFPTRSPKGPRRVQNAENLLEDVLGLGSDAPPVVIMSDRLAEKREETEDLMRLAMSLGHRGARDLIQKPFPTAGRTLDRVIKKVLGLANGNGAGQRLPTEVGPGISVIKAELTPPIAQTEWLTVTQAAELLMHDLPGLSLAKARSRISTAAGRKEFKFAGIRRDRRIEPHTFASWRLKQRDRDLDGEDDPSDE